MLRTQVVLGCTGLLALWGVVAEAQSLAEIAKREKERRAKLSKPTSKVYSNDDLRTRAPSTADQDSTEPADSPEQASRGAAHQRGRGAAIRAGASAPLGEGSAGERGEAYWRSRSQRARAAVSRAERRVAELEAKAASQGPVVPGPLPAACSEGILVGGPVTDMKRPAGKVCDPEVLRAQETQRVQGELTRARAELEQAKKALEALAEEARRAGALPGWLR
jgi:hypothetical protein